MEKRRTATSLVILGLLVALMGGWFWHLVKGWRYAPIVGILIPLGLWVAVAGIFGNKKSRQGATQILSQVACLLILTSVVFPVLWVVGMAMDPRDILRPLDLSPITNIPANLLRIAPKRFPLPEGSIVLDLEPVPAQDRSPHSIDVLGTYYDLPGEWTLEDLQRDEVWVIGSTVIAWQPLVLLAEGSTSLSFPGQVTLLPPEVKVESLLPLESAVRADGWIVLEGQYYAVPRAWSLKRVDRPTLWLLDNQIVHWGVLNPIPEDQEMVTALVVGEEPSCWIGFDDEETRYTCPEGVRVEQVDEPAYWLSSGHMGLCNGTHSSDISKVDLTDTRHSPAIWFQGNKVVDWRDSSSRAFASVINRPTANPVNFPRLLLNSTMLAVGVSLFCMLVGTTAAYAFSRFDFPGRQAGMLGFVIVLMMPSVATLAPLFVILNALKVSPSLFQWGLLIAGAAAGLVGLVLMLLRMVQRPEGWGWIIQPLLLIALGVLLDLNALQSLAQSASDPFILRKSLWGVGIAMVAGALPFSIWNMKGFIDTIPKELEEAALIDGASATQTFFRIMLPLALPGLAVTALFGFIAGWTEFVLSWQFLTNPGNFTLAMALYGMQGERNTPWSNFAAMSILVSIPVTGVFFALQKYIVGGLTLGGVKG